MLPRPDHSKIDELCARYVQDGGPGLALAVLQDGAVAYRKTFGLASLEHGVPITPETVFEAASVSKQFTGFAVHLLIQDGTLSLDDDIRQYVPDIPDFGAPITLRHCLHHTCGLREWGDAMGFAGRIREDVWEHEYVMRWLTRQRGLNHPPGAEHLYSNTGYFVLAEVVAAASGQSFSAFCKARIFDPLGMTNTHFRDNVVAVIKNQANSYFRFDDGTFGHSISNQALPGATSLQLTIDDMVRWLENFETAKVGGAALLASMHEPGFVDGQSTHYASGLELGTYRGEEIVYHSGGWAGFVALTWRMPSRRLSISVLSNWAEMNVYEFWPPLVDLFMGDQATQPKTTPRPLDVPNSELVGLYSGTSGPVVQISEMDDKLFSGPRHSRSTELVPLGGLRLHPMGHPETIIEFKRDAAGKVVEYGVSSKGVKQEARLRLKEMDDRIELGEFSGMFYSCELQTAYRVWNETDTLILSSLTFGDEPLQNIGRDFFVEAEDQPNPNVYRFERDESGTITALLIGTCDARNQRFERLPDGVAD